ncbi:MAG: 23S rRNA (guanosine(2251)-2'-O)-methyltransferase RlmB, partial [Oscillospiraceae bacterium]|nr:23S rRNA (guanosine(2251)-2'-O)-methyltransferase RlmB [Oscillospiraceae bacterium]
MLIYGKNPVAEALKAGLEIKTLYISGQSEISLLAAGKNVNIKTLSAQQLSSLCGNAAHQGAAADVNLSGNITVENLIERAENKGERPFIVICDEIQDPHNLGAIIRTAEAAGVHGVI